jgi:hypothetical protein
MRAPGHVRSRFLRSSGRGILPAAVLYAVPWTQVRLQRQRLSWPQCWTAHRTHVRRANSFNTTRNQKFAAVPDVSNPCRRTTVAGPGSVCLGMLILGRGPALKTSGSLRLDVWSIPIRGFRFALCRCFNFKVVGSQTVRQHNLSNLVDCACAFFAINVSACACNFFIFSRICSRVGIVISSVEYGRTMP